MLSLKKHTYGGNSYDAQLRREMCGFFGGNPYEWWFRPKGCNVNSYIGDPAICGLCDQNSMVILVVILMCDRLVVLGKRAVTILVMVVFGGHRFWGHFGVEPFWPGPLFTKR